MIPQGPEAYGYRSGAWTTDANRAIRAAVWHTTGAGILARFDRDPAKYGTPFGAALWVFRNQKAGAHFVIGQGRGELVQIAPLEAIAWHVGKAQSWGYRGGKLSRSRRFDWWRERWCPQGLQGPHGLAGGRLWDGGQCNPNTVGIEIVPALGNGPWSDHAWESIRIVQRSLADRVPLDPLYQIGHSDAHPHARTTKRAPGIGWDPPPGAWDPWTHCARLRAA